MNEQRGILSTSTAPQGKVSLSSSHPESESIPELSIVMPCLNEESAIGACISKARQALDLYGIRGEIIIADNGSTDRSVVIAQEMGTRVVFQPRRGYGSAYLKGIAEARGRAILLADSDDSYDFFAIDRFRAALESGYDFVNGTRFKGTILPGAMPWMNRYIGNPFLSGLLNLLFHTGLSDIHCGMRAFTKEAYERMRVRSLGMEFASEMIIHAAKAGLKMTEVPITYAPRRGQSKLKPVRDGWRHLRFILLYSPTALFLIPGLLLFFPGLIGLLALTPGPIPFKRGIIDLHTMIACSMAMILGLQIATLGICAKTYSLTEHFDEDDPLLAWINRHITLEVGLLTGLVLTIIGLLPDIKILVEWLQTNFGALNEIRPALFSLTFIVIGIQIIFSSFFLSLLRSKKGDS